MNKPKPPADFDENPVWTAADFAAAKAVPEPEAVAKAFRNRGGRPRKANPKVPVNFRMDPELIDGLREMGAGWQTRINDAVREYLERRRA